MRWPWTLLIVGAVLCFVLFMFAPTDDPAAECNFCSGSGQGSDCPRNDPAARAACIDSVKNHYCGPHPENCG